MTKILIANSFGAGWSTWHQTTNIDETIFMLTYQPFIDQLETGERITQELKDKFYIEFIQRFPNASKPYDGGIKNLSVQSVNGPFLINEYDGYESIQERDTTDWLHLK